jgi:hypothetical protein
VTNAGIKELDMLRVGGVCNGNYTDAADSCVGLNTSDNSAILEAGSICGEGVNGVGLLNDDGFFGVGG